jgi:hypothetical protein
LWSGLVGFVWRSLVRVWVSRGGQYSCQYTAKGYVREGAVLRVVRYVTVSRGEAMRLRWNNFYDVPSSRKPLRPPVMQLESFRQARGLSGCHWTNQIRPRPERRRSQTGPWTHCGATTGQQVLQLAASDGPRGSVNHYSLVAVGR